MKLTRLNIFAMSLFSELVFLNALDDRSAVAKPLQSRVLVLASKRSIARFDTC